MENPKQIQTPEQKPNPWRETPPSPEVMGNRQPEIIQPLGVCEPVLLAEAPNVDPVAKALSSRLAKKTPVDPVTKALADRLVEKKSTEFVPDASEEQRLRAQVPEFRPSEARSQLNKK